LVHNNMGLALLKIKKPKEALQYITRSIELYPENAYAFKHLGMARLALKQKDEACDAWEKALNLGYRKTYDNEVDDLINKNCRRKK
jgi:Tfp pilus assembly protein PilF